MADKNSPHRSSSVLAFLTLLFVATLIAAACGEPDGRFGIEVDLEREPEVAIDFVTTADGGVPYYSGATQSYPLSLFQAPVLELAQLPDPFNLPVVTAVVDVSNPYAPMAAPSADVVRDLLFTAPNSPAAWFAENSLGTAQLVDAGVFNVTLPQTGAYYWGDGKHQEREVDAIRELEKQIDFSQYKGDDDRIDSRELVVIVWTPEAGRLLGLARDTGEADGSDLRVDGVRLKTKSLELFMDIGRDPNSVAGLLTHEISHLVGTADLYDDGCAFEFDGREYERAGHLSILGDVSAVSNLDAYHRLKLGWFKKAVVVQNSSTYSLGPVGETGDLLVIPAPNSDYTGNGTVDLEYFLLEYRTGAGNLDWPELRGLAVWRISEQTANLDDCWSRRAVSLIRADPRVLASGSFSDRLALYDPSDAARAGPIPSDTVPGLGLRRKDPAGNWLVRDSGITISNLVSAGNRLSFDIAYEPAVVVFPEVPPIDLDDLVPVGDLPNP